MEEQSNDPGRSSLIFWARIPTRESAWEEAPILPTVQRTSKRGMERVGPARERLRSRPVWSSTWPCLASSSAFPIRCSGQPVPSSTSPASMSRGGDQWPAGFVELARHGPIAAGRTWPLVPRRGIFALICSSRWLANCDAMGQKGCVSSVPPAVDPPYFIGCCSSGPGRAYDASRMYRR
jgi:hypothetical protein